MLVGAVLAVHNEVAEFVSDREPLTYLRVADVDLDSGSDQPPVQVTELASLDRETLCPSDALDVNGRLTLPVLAEEDSGFAAGIGGSLRGPGHRYGRRHGLVVFDLQLPLAYGARTHGGELGALEEAVAAFLAHKLRH